MLAVMFQVQPSAVEVNVALVTHKNDDAAALHAARKNYFKNEYTLDYYLSEYSKPMVAVMDGITSISQSPQF